MRIVLIIVCFIGLAAEAAAAEKTSPKVGATQQRPVATQPSNNPFKDPIGQGVPPAASKRYPNGYTNPPRGN